MEKITYWEEIFDNFLNALIQTFPNKNLNVYRENLLGLRNKGLRIPIVKHVLSYLEPHFELIKNCDIKLFQSSEPVYLLKSIDFRDFFNGTSIQTQVAIWSHLQSVYIAGKRVLDEDTEKLISIANMKTPKTIPPSLSDTESINEIMSLVKDLNPEELFAGVLKGKGKKDMSSLMTSLMSNPAALQTIENKIKEKLSSGTVNLDKLTHAAEGLMSKIQTGDYSEIEKALNK
jgi:hypothetical protein